MQHKPKFLPHANEFLHKHAAKELVVIVWQGTYLKCIFNTHTVVQTDNDTRIMVKSRYFPNNGTAKEVGGIISANNKKNTVKDTRIEIHNVTCQRYVYM